jgi:5-methylcytosine-specific restriction protein A
VGRDRVGWDRGWVERSELVGVAMSGWHGERTASSRRTSTRAWRTIAEQIRQRDNHRCVLCGRPARQVDHITPVVDGGSDEPQNLRTICDLHHSAKTARDSRRARPERKRPSEQHPGVIPTARTGG